MTESITFLAVAAFCGFALLAGAAVIIAGVTRCRKCGKWCEDAAECRRNVEDSE